MRTSFPVVGCLLGLNPWAELTGRRRHLLQDEYHSGGNPRFVPGFLNSCSKMFLERFRIVHGLADSEETR